MYYNIIIIQMVRVMAKRQEEHEKTVVIEKFATGNKCHNIRIRDIPSLSSLVILLCKVVRDLSLTYKTCFLLQ